ncbi:MAG TPA: DUF885 domain-containing protein, partial [Steroidobacteraceae bacterium]|nr:DUF885 domain-containing protein [Steroidobacteraceae bacterium]
YDNYIARLRAWPRYVGEQIEQMRRGLARGMTVPRAVLDGYEGTISAHVVDDPAKSVFWAPFEKFPSTVPEKERERLRQEGRSAVVEGAVVGYKQFLDFFRQEYLPHARQTLGASELPNGKAYYAHRIRQFTTLDLPPEEIHKLGLAEVERISGEMNAVMKQANFQGDFAAFLKFLRTDPRFYAKTPDELLKDASYIAKQIDGLLPGYFGKLPRQPYSVQPVPAELAPNYTGGRYSPAPLGGTKGGEYWVNTYALEKRPLYVLTALTLHEAVPGHHLQGALARELENVPPFRLDLYPHAFGEGWGLYSEKLGKEMGLYKTPYDEFGRLTYEMWRACRLVVDTGMHWKGWTRDQALEYLGSNTALSLHEVTTETNRYIAWPGQALAYKMGELKILELRKKAHDTLGDRFDIRAFHDAVMENGGVPLPILEKQIDEYIAAAQKK